MSPTDVRRARVPRRRSLLAAGILVLGGLSPAAVLLPDRPAKAAASLNSSDVTANLWEWNWPSVAAACTDHLGPTGYGAVQVAPPAESVSLASTDDGAHPWWEVYQPVSYDLTSRLGTRAQFSAMVTACHDAGVRVYVDAVINHTAGHNNTVNTTYGGSTFDPAGFSYPAVPYGYGDFHHANDGYCNDEDAGIDDWNDTSEVQNCELVSLSDLKTQTGYVRGKIAGYLNDLIGLGVDGFRIDAAKHIAQSDFAAIKGALNPTTAEGKAPYIAQEVFPGATDPDLKASAFTSNGDVLGFAYAMGLKTQFQNGTLSNLSGIPSWSLDAESSQTYAMITNHDTERDGSTLSYKNGGDYTLATYFLLAYPYGKPTVYDGFTWSSKGQSPPADSNGFVTAANCAGGWQCLTRSTGIKGMVGWRNATASASTVSDFTATAGDVIGFSRGSRGWIGLNDSSGPSTASYRTGLADGVYCDVITGGLGPDGCAGTAVTVSGGAATVTIPAGGAVAIHADAKAGATPTPATVTDTFRVHATTTWGTSVYLVGNVPALGSWDPAKAVKLSSAGYPVWSGEVTLPARTEIQYKYVKKTDAGAVTWESGANRTYTTGTSGRTADDTWR
ncbi:carbohydrate-binding module family 20 domain-containing protein [Actinomadura madurae]|uniref:carbohydrate-binding module family 20 domain-containing protein n=1 Tax=Actinomadura madurae TaxID=1993 RepID=UPI0020D208C8|nr:carbohydrate-binding module family 20 domain-containing protein [Actinomadura madurae]MCP9948454.1 alpha-amylase family glycosyl hydrolase [Actinomadura madurae]MCP9965233.1 alpha-amylase family glycosyl hydrolase [Actinomadura madurae]MCP9977723.1 alpha-amylase family glycosyl hydrolase [Actinomadura madurae]MCQ0010787.1 alpha-amylase family glycosyl hydrolase [Actinomadura madurae]